MDDNKQYKAIKQYIVQKMKGATLRHVIKEETRAPNEKPLCQLYRLEIHYRTDVVQV